MHAPTPAPSLLVGRDRELAILKGQRDAALAGQGSLVLIGGTAGIGKTTLAEAFCREVHEQGISILVGRCFERSETPAYGPWLDLFDRYRPTDGVPPPPAAFAERGTIGQVASQAALFRQVLGFFEACAVQRPLLLLLDDLHWADPASLDLLRFLTRFVPSLPMLVLATYRDDEIDDRPLYGRLPSLVREGETERLALHTLDDRAVRTLVSDRYHLSGADATRLVTYLAQRAEGNPFFIGEVLRTLEDEGVLRTDAAHSTLADLGAVRVPALLRQVIQGRLARLDTESQRLLSVAAVIGQEVSLPLWTTIAEAGDEALLTAIEVATTHRMIEPTADGMRVRFMHALIRETLYEGILPPRRRLLHGRIGTMLAERRDADADAVAYHFQQAGDARAAEWLVQAGDHAERVYAWTTAIAHFDGALAILADDDAQAATRGWVLLRLALLSRFANPTHALGLLAEAEAGLIAARDPLLAACLHVCRGNMRCLARDITCGLAEMEEGAAAVGALSTRERLHLRAIPPTMLRMIADDGDSLRGMWLAFSGRYDPARTLCERVIASPQDGDASKSTARAYAAIGLAATYAAYGLPDDARRAYGEAIRGFAASAHFVLLVNALWSLMRGVQLTYDTEDLAGRDRLLAEADRAVAQLADPEVGAEYMRVLRHAVWLLEGQWDALAEVTAAKNAEGRPELTMPQQSISPVEGILLAVWRGDSAQAWAAIQAYLPHGPTTRPGDDTYLYCTEVQRAAAALALDSNDPETARQWLDAHDRWLAWSGGVVEGRAEGEFLWGRYHRHVGDTEQAFQHAARALATATTPRQPLALIAAHRLLAALATGARRDEEAGQHLEQALTLADACRAPYERALTLLALATLQTVQGAREAAVRSLEAMRAICVPLGANPALARADALAADLSADTGATPPYPAGLSAREVEVLRLLAAGRTNRQIAADLFLSPATVRHHVEHILAKTNSENRAAAAAFAQRHGFA